ncbi:MAG TPA: HD domain-containing protein [Candidatus Poseidoniales archaeon]|jgi:putative hydrolases of HD superfamily|nr:MAG: hypothetical protein CXT71_07645 [Euryarchaeota archaeon]HIF46468.1 HD domain-containing protein [Candidatus Poseidoniales archaeon]HIL65853.1 HD domain-containing protein [Candidatus Poseidoniales archaeon]
MRRLLELKQVLRTGWVRAGVEQPESVAAHSWGMAILAMEHCPPQLDKLKVLEMCIIHDLPEVIVGDLTPHDDTTNKKQDELNAMKILAPEWLALFEEYEDQITPESKFVKYLDKRDMASMARFYQETQGINLSEFINSTRDVLTEKDYD